jgi:hypothetical protein
VTYLDLVLWVIAAVYFRKILWTIMDPVNSFTQFVSCQSAFKAGAASSTPIQATDIVHEQETTEHSLPYHERLKRGAL